MKEIRRALLMAVGQRVAANGFDSKPITRSFLRRSPVGREAFHLAFINHADDFDVKADVAVRIDDLEDVVNADNTLLSKKERKETYSLGAELENIAGEGPKRWTVASSADVDPVADQIVARFKTVGLPYLNRASSLEAAYQLLTSPGRGAWLHSPIHASRAKRVVALAKILGRTDELQARVNENIQFLERLNDPGLQEFKQFAEQLGVKV
jgi:hypothetical protein